MISKLLFSLKAGANQYGRVIGLLAVLLFFTNVICRAQVALTINAETRTVTFEGKWRAGKDLSIKVDSFHKTSFDSLSVAYRAAEYTNTKGIAAFAESKAGLTELRGSPSYNLLPIQIQEKDDAYVTISLYNNGKKIDEQVYYHRVAGGVKFDVSTGAFMTGLRNEAYALKPVSDSTNQIIAERRGRARIGTGILAHLHTRWTRCINFGLSGGFELNTDARIGYLAGGSIFIGHDRKFVISGGVVASRKIELSRVYRVNETISREITSVPMVEVWAGGWFWGLSYNF